jgi:hypothetical protein
MWVGVVAAGGGGVVVGGGGVVVVGGVVGGCADPLLTNMCCNCLLHNLRGRCTVQCFTTSRAPPENTAVEVVQHTCASGGNVCTSS